MEHVKYKTIMSKHMYPKFQTCFTEHVNFDEVHFPVIGTVSEEKYYGVLWNGDSGISQLRLSVQ